MKLRTQVPLPVDADLPTSQQVLFTCCGVKPWSHRVSEPSCCRANNNLLLERLQYVAGKTMTKNDLHSKKSEDELQSKQFLRAVMIA
jgi:hypothetical protein